MRTAQEPAEGAAIGSGLPLIAAYLYQERYLQERSERVTTLFNIKSTSVGML